MLNSTHCPGFPLVVDLPGELLGHRRVRRQVGLTDLLHLLVAHNRRALSDASSLNTRQTSANQFLSQCERLSTSMSLHEEP